MSNEVFESNAYKIRTDFKTLSTQSKRIGNEKALPKCLVD